MINIEMYWENTVEICQALALHSGLKGRLRPLWSMTAKGAGISALSADVSV